MPDPVHEHGLRFGHQRFDGRIAGVTVWGADAHLDQFMVIERPVDLGDNGRRDTGAADEDAGFQTMRETAQETSLMLTEVHGGAL